MKTNAILEAVGRAVTTVALDPLTPIPAREAAAVSAQVKKEAAREMAADPAVQHAKFKAHLR